MEQVVAVELEEYSRALDIAFARQMHAPVHVFVGAVIRAAAEQGAADDAPSAREKGGDGEGDGSGHNQRRAVPPGHGNGLLVLFMDQMIGVIGLENLMMDQGVALERVGEFSERLVHDKAVYGPFEK